MSDDVIDRIAKDWRRERPDLDLSAMATLGRLSFLAHNVIGSASNRAVSQHGIGPAEFDVLATLRRSGSPYTLSPSVLSAELMMSRAGMTKRLDRLEQAGLVQRSLAVDDRRSFRVALTATGRTTVDAALTELADCLNGLASGLSDRDRVSLDRLLRILMRAAAEAAPGR